MKTFKGRGQRRNRRNRDCVRHDHCVALRVWHFFERYGATKDDFAAMARVSMQSFDAADLGALMRSMP